MSDELARRSRFGLTAVAGLRVGHFTDRRRPTGCTVILAVDGAVAGVDVRGAAPGTRETELLSPLNSVESVHAIVLAGGSAFGLDTAGGVMRWLDEREIGFPVVPARRRKSLSEGGAAHAGNAATAAPADSGDTLSPADSWKADSWKADSWKPDSSSSWGERDTGPGGLRGAGSGPAPSSPAIRVPIVPAAILFDLWLGDPTIRPNADAGYAACVAASSDTPAEGNVGAGAGASVGKLFGTGRAMKGGIGTASITVGGITVAALVAVNAVGDVIDPANGQTIAGARTPDGLRLLGSMAALRNGEWPAPAPPGTATTLAVVATDAVLSKVAANKMAQMAHDGLARSINPVHTMSDGDVVFALGTGTSGMTAHTTWLGALAADVLAEAVLRGVRAARGVGGAGVPHLPAAGDL